MDIIMQTKMGGKCILGHSVPPEVHPAPPYPLPHPVLTGWGWETEYHGQTLLEDGRGEASLGARKDKQPGCGHLIPLLHVTSDM